MPSFCIVESCKLAKQIGDKISYHKYDNLQLIVFWNSNNFFNLNGLFRFPFHKTDVFEKWIEFLQCHPSDPTKKSKDKKISRYSSICSRHFTASDFKDCRLKKTAYPTVHQKAAVTSVDERKNEEEEIVEIGTEDPLSSDVCSLCQDGKNHRLLEIDDFYIALITKCLPFVVQLSFLQKLCSDCAQHLTNFSLFIDKIILAQNQMQMLPIVTESVTANNLPAAPSVRKIKVEPMSTFEQEEKLPSIHVIDFVQQSQQKSQQQKCEILEIVDIKPFSFDGNIQQENPEDDEIQILSPKQLKVELTDHDEEAEASNILAVFRQDHNYVRNDVIEIAEPNVKTERIDDESLIISRPSKICSLCNKSFSTIKKYLIHKISKHPRSKTRRLQFSQSSCGSKTVARKKENFTAKTNSGKTFQCPDCSKSFSGSKSLYQHSMSHKASSYTCHVCDKKFKRKHGLTQHFKSIHEQEKTHVCHVCNYRYLLKADMLRCRHSKLKRQRLSRTYILKR